MKARFRWLSAVAFPMTGIGCSIVQIVYLAGGGRLSHSDQIQWIAMVAVWAGIAMAWNLLYLSLRRRSITFQDMKVQAPVREMR